MQRARLIAVLLAVGATVAAGVWWMRSGEVMGEPGPMSEQEREIRGAVRHRVSAELVNEVLRIEAQEKQVAETVWAKEMLAQECGRTIERLWDEIKGATNRLEVVSKFAVGEVELGRWNLVEELPHGVRLWRASGKIEEAGRGSGITRPIGRRSNPSPQPSPLTGAREEKNGAERKPALLTEARKKSGAKEVSIQSASIGKEQLVDEAIRGAGTREERLRGEEWKGWVEGKMREGWRLEQIEFRQIRFEMNGGSGPERSVFYFAANLMREGRIATEMERVSLEGDLEVRWGGKGDDGWWRVTGMDGSGLMMKVRVGEPVFELVKDEVVEPNEQERWIDPLMVYDLDGDGSSEIILAARNFVYSPRRLGEHTEERGLTQGTQKEFTAEGAQGEAAWASRELCRFPEGFLGTAVLAEVTGDGRVDFIGAKWEGVFVFEGAAGGLFPEKAKLAWKAEKPIERAMVMTCGDVDGDGDVDLFLGQYKDPYEGGVTPRPFHDANDGYPSYLLVNQGGGVFVDGTLSAGLEKKRNRRTFSASFVDLDGDEDLDLMVVSDFAGADFYTNDGKGRFTDVTSQWIREPGARMGFGMAHSLADFNRDGLLDVLMIGMTSPTVDRLNHLGLMRTTNAAERAIEAAMTYGNRLMFGKRGGGFERSAVGDSIARAGWAWGCANLDFDNDGWVDVYIANGFQSQGTVQDSEGDYWLHDRFLESAMGAQATDLYFKSSGARNRGSVRSFGGHERNRFYWNRGGTNFLEVGYLLGVSVTADSRNVVADDLDGDGRMDLVMTTSEFWPEEKKTLKVFKNGAQIVGEAGERKAPGVYATGAGFRSQGPADVRE